MEIYSKTDIGRVRETNQDAVLVKKISDDFAWSLVCDGMGGTYGGDVASRTAVKVIENYMDSFLSENDSLDEIKTKIHNAVNDANLKIFEKSKMDENLNHMGTTVVLCVARNNLIQIVYAGDSRIYIVNKDEIHQLSKDHSIVQEMLDSGEISAQDAKNHPQKNIITRALGINSEIKLDYIEYETKKEDIILSCSDGLTNCLDEENIYNICNRNEISSLASDLVREANNRGGSDNITVALIKI